MKQQKSDEGPGEREGSLPDSERRVHPRKTLRTQVVFEDESGEGFIYFYTTDVSIGGLFFESDIPLKIGTQVFLSFRLGEGGATIRTIGRVVRVARESADSPAVVGLGVQYVDLSEESRQVIQSYAG